MKHPVSGRSTRVVAGGFSPAYAGERPSSACPEPLLAPHTATMSGCAMITGIDHILLQVRDLDAAIADYQTLLGRAPNWLGSFPSARHAWFQLPNIALDIVA